MDEPAPSYTLVDITDDGVNATRVHVWTAGHAIYMEGDYAYLFTKDDPMRDTPCIVCGERAAQQPVRLSIIVVGEHCETGEAHVPAFCALRHIDCQQKSQSETVADILASVSRCAG